MFTSILSVILVINEVMASNAGQAISPAYNYDSWVELYNPSDEAVNIGGMTFSDSNGHTWQMPQTMGSVAAKDFKVVWFGSGEIKSDQAPFKLDCDGGTITLTDRNGNVVAAQTYPEALSRTAWARTTDGGEQWRWTADATPGESNATATFADTRLDAPVVSQNSTLFKSSLSVKVNIPAGARLMYTTDGSLPVDLATTTPWKQQVKNGSCEATGNVSLLARNYGGNGDDNTITAGIGTNGSHGIKVTSSKNAQNDHEAQLFIYTPDHIWKTGERYRFHMMVKADKAAKMTTQTHTTPHTYIANNMFDGKTYNVGTEWMAIDYEGTITDSQVGKKTTTTGGWGGWGGWETVTYEDMQTIAFNLNVDRLDNTFYFDDVSWELYDNNISTQESKNGQFTVSNTSGYTFRLFKDGYLPSVPVTRSYIKTSNSYTLPIVSIVGDRRFFTDPMIGIDCDGSNGKTGNGQDTPRNYNQDWDRPVNLSYLSPSGEMLYNQDVSIKVSGGWTRSQRYRSFKLKASKIFDGMNRYDYAFFPQKPYIRSKTLLVRNGGNDVWIHNARFLDPALETIIQRSGIDLDVQSCVPVIEYVNGELRGVLNLREPNNDDFAYANFGYDDEELDAFENMVMKNGDDKALSRIFELARDINAEGAYEELCQLLDIDEFTNYMATTMFLDNDDWPNNNIKAYRSKLDGRYRFVSFDLDYAFALRGFNTKGDNPFTYFQQFKDASTVNGESNLNREIVRLLFNLLGHDGYRRKYIDTFCLVAGSVFEPTRAGAIVDELLAKVKPMTQLMKQQGINDGHDPDRAASTIKNKLSGRTAKMTTNMQQFSPMKLSGVKKHSVTLKTDTKGARIEVNGINVPYADFNGVLFSPVRLKAVVPAGYQFAGWKKGNTLVSADKEIDMPTDNTVSLTATFTKLSDSELTAKGITPVRINEVSAGNGIYVNEFFKRNDWLELYNTTDEDIDVEGMYLTDNVSKPQKYQITSGDTKASTIVPAHGYLIIWCDKLDPLSQLHASFKLSDDGGDVMLTAEDGEWSDLFSYTAMKSDETAGRYPDGSANVITMNVPTIAAANITSSYATTIEQSGTAGISDMLAANDLSVRYSDYRLTVQATGNSNVTITVTNMSGQNVLSQQLNTANGRCELSVLQLTAGVYIASVTDNYGRTATCKFIVR